MTLSLFCVLFCFENPFSLGWPWYRFCRSGRPLTQRSDGLGLEPPVSTDLHTPHAQFVSGWGSLHGKKAPHFPLCECVWNSGTCRSLSERSVSELDPQSLSLNFINIKALQLNQRCVIVLRSFYSTEGGSLAAVIRWLQTVFKGWTLNTIIYLFLPKDNINLQNVTFIFVSSFFFFVKVNRKLAPGKIVIK